MPPEAIADPEAFEKAAKDFARAVRKNPFSGDGMPKLGMAGLVAPVNSLGGFPSYNATRGVFDSWEKISGEHMAELLAKRGGKTGHKGCSNCAIQCSNEFVDDGGKYVTGKLDPLKTEGQVEASRHHQIIMAVVDSIGLCVLASYVLSTPEGGDAFMRAVSAKLGVDWELTSLSALGTRILKAERAFNRRAGFTNKDDRLPAFFYEEPLPPHNTVVQISDEDMDKTFEF